MDAHLNGRRSQASSTDLFEGNSLRNVPSIAELRRICQDPVREYNDLAGALYGWRFSIYITSVFLRLGLTANYASILMWCCGLSGSLLLLFPGYGRIAGMALITFAFIMDCVDGEIARYHKIDSYRWAAFDYIHHLTVKALSFVCLGIGLYVEFATPWAMAAGGLGSIFWLVLMIIRDLATSLFTKKIVMNDRRDRNPAYLRLVENLKEMNGRDDASRHDAPSGGEVWGAGFRFRPWMIRTFLVSFDMVAPTFLATAIADRFIGRFDVAGIALTPSLALLYAYAILLPFHSIDLLYGAMRRGGLRRELYDLAKRVERFRS